MFFLRFFQERTAVAQRVSIRLLPCPLNLLDHIQLFASTAPFEPILSSLTLFRKLRPRSALSHSAEADSAFTENWLHNEGRRKKKVGRESKGHRMNSMQTSFTGLGKVEKQEREKARERERQRQERDL
jgi:hypothetical protein